MPSNSIDQSNFMQFGCTPLHRAASTGNIVLCEFLIEEGAEIDESDRAGQTPLMTAVVCDDKDVIFYTHTPLITS